MPAGDVSPVTSGRARALLLQHGGGGGGGENAHRRARARHATERLRDYRLRHFLRTQHAGKCGFVLGFFCCLFVFPRLRRSTDIK